MGVLLSALLALAQAGHPDVYRIDLVPTPDLRTVEGTVRLGWTRTPFGVAVSPDGHHRYELSMELEGLPEPAILGEYSTYVAWVTTPLMHPLVKLGEVRNGANASLGRVELNQFIVLVSAEASSDVATRDGRLVLRGRSPSMSIQPDNHLMLPPTKAVGGAHGMHGRDAWPHPPMHPLISMIPGLEDLTPGVRAFVPRIDRGQHVVAARPREVVKLVDGQTLDLEATPVRRTIHGHTYIMYGFNGQYPGPLIEVAQRSTITVNFENRTDLPTAIHWHGVRLDNRYDGVPGVTQDPVAPGASFQYRIFFRDAGLYWYHPHHREDIQQELGLYGNMLVRAPEPEFFNEVHREEILMLDDLLVTSDAKELFPFGEERATHALMGRFGNVLLVNGEPEYQLDVDRGEVVRFFLTNVSNTRTFNLSFDGAPIKVVGSDLGKLERETWAESVVIAPAERYIVEVRFDESVALTNRVQILDHSFGTFSPEITELGAVTVSSEPATPELGFDTLREHEDVIRDLEPYRTELTRPVDHELELTLEISGLPPKLMQRLRADRVYFTPVEWSGTMPMMNFPSTSNEVSWILRDVETGKENMDIDWRFDVGDVVKIRLVNDRDAIHAMQHPFHIHGQRFLVLSRNGVANDNLVWKDTMLLAVGEVADILLEISNPGRWMAHCHIAEHLETGMKFVFNVES